MVMEKNNNEKRSLVILVLIFLFFVLTANYFTLNPFPYFVVASIGMTFALIRIFSGGRAKFIAVNSSRILVRKYETPFRLVERTYSLNEVSFQKSSKLVGENTFATMFIAKNNNDEALFILSTELSLWKENDIKEILQFIDDHKAK